MKLAFIGAGKMAEALMESLLRSGVVRASSIQASDVDPARPAALSARLGIGAAADNRDAVRKVDIVFLCVKPQQLDAVLAELAPELTARHLLISIAAGKTLADIAKRAPGIRAIRVMPNVCCLVGAGMNVFTPGASASEEDRKTAARLLGACGLTRELPEAQFDAVTALSGSGPAFFARFLLHMVEAAQAEGLSAADALALANQTMLGTARLLMEGPTDPAQLIRNVTSARGTTAEGLAVLDQSSFADTVHAMIAAAARRSRELRQPS
jgi:pyrroline-5-carboxylate reductase